MPTSVNVTVKKIHAEMAGMDGTYTRDPKKDIPNGSGGVMSSTFIGSNGQGEVLAYWTKPQQYCTLFRMGSSGKPSNMWLMLQCSGSFVESDARGGQLTCVGRRSYRDEEGISREVDLEVDLVFGETGNSPTPTNDSPTGATDTSLQCTAFVPGVTCPDPTAKESSRLEVTIAGGTYVVPLVAQSDGVFAGFAPSRASTGIYVAASEGKIKYAVAPLATSLVEAEVTKASEGVYSFAGGTVKLVSGTDPFAARGMSVTMIVVIVCASVGGFILLCLIVYFATRTPQASIE
jgi:hypothetical protein